MMSRAARGAYMAGLMVAACAAFPAKAYLFWTQPDFSGPPVRGDEPGIALPLPGATPAEIQANLLWTLRAALNVAALQCQFAPPLMTVDNYNTILSQHGQELAAAYSLLGSYFRRTRGAGWQRALDAHSTQTYNGLSTFKAQYGFCQTAGHVGRIALAAPRERLAEVAIHHMREVRNSLVPRADPMLVAHAPAPLPLPSFADRCWRKGQLRKQCTPAA